jgi:hypothetical protein
MEFLNPGKKLKTKGKLFWKKEWYSICSIHRQYKEDCGMCNTGHYVNVWMNKISNFIFRNFPELWRWYVKR